MLGQVPLHRRNVHRARQVVDDRIEQRLHTLVLEGGATEHRHDLAGDGRLPDGPHDLLERQLLAAQVLRHQLVIVLDRRLDDFMARLLDPLLVGIRHRHFGERLAHVLLVEHELDPAQHVDVPGEQLTGTDRQLDREGVLREAAPDHAEAAIEIGADAVHLVGKDDARHVVPVSLAPHRLGLRLHAGHGIEQRHGAVEHAQRPLHLDREVHVSRRIDDVDAVHDVVPGPETGRGSRRDRDAALLLLLHPVHRGGTLMHFTDLVVLPGVVQDALGRGRLTGIDVGHDADIPVTLERCVSRHNFLEPVPRRRWRLHQAKSGATDPGNPVVSLRAHPGNRPGRGPIEVPCVSEGQRWGANAPST